MRPDEHKRKRSAQYKKKHGMSKDDQTKDSRQPKSKSTSGKSKVKVDQNAQGKHSGRHSGAAKLSQSSSGSDSSDHDQDSATTNKSFRRREVVSNWARYEILPEEAETTQKKGDDFFSLLSTAGGGSSQFRFKEEEDWDEGESVSTDAKLLAVDLSDLTASLQCIPLYHRLGVEQDLFSTEQIQEMDFVARENAQRYQPRCHAVDPKQPNKTSYCTSDQTLPHGDGVTERETGTGQETVTERETGTETGTDVSGVTGREIGADVSGVTGRETGADVSGVTGRKTGADVSGVTERLGSDRPVGDDSVKALTDHQGSVVSCPEDRLCSTSEPTCVGSRPVVRTPVINTPKVDTPIVNTPAVSTPVIHTPVINTPVVNSEETGGVSTSNLDDDLDFLLSLDNPTCGLGETTQQNSVQEKASIPPQKTQSSVSKTGLEKETENLEDWLDSVLD